MNDKTTAAMADDAQSAVSKAISSAEDMIVQAANATGEKAAEMRGRALEQLKALRERLQDVQTTALEKGKAAATATDDYVHEYPWYAVLAAVTVGLVVGLVVGSSRD